MRVCVDSTSQGQRAQKRRIRPETLCTSAVLRCDAGLADQLHCRRLHDERLRATKALHGKGLVRQAGHVEELIGWRLAA